MTDNEPKGWEKEFDNGVALKIGNAGKSEGIQNVRREIKDFIRDNFIPKAEVRKVIGQRKADAVNVFTVAVLEDLLRALHISDE